MVLRISIVALAFVVFAPCFILKKTNDHRRPPKYSDACHVLSPSNIKDWLAISIRWEGSTCVHTHTHYGGKKNRTCKKELVRLASRTCKKEKIKNTYQECVWHRLTTPNHEWLHKVSRVDLWFSTTWLKRRKKRKKKEKKKNLCQYHHIPYGMM